MNLLMNNADDFRLPRSLGWAAFKIFRSKECLLAGASPPKQRHSAFISVAFKRRIA